MICAAFVTEVGRYHVPLLSTQTGKTKQPSMAVFFVLLVLALLVVVVDSIVITVLAVAETVDKNLSILGVIRDCGGSFYNCLVEFKQKPPSDTKVLNLE